MSPTATLLPSGKVLVVGGADSNSEPLATTELYDPATDTWSQAPDMTFPRTQHIAALLPSGQVLVAGGMSPLSGYGLVAVASAELFTENTNGTKLNRLPSRSAR
jgi:hypothetical protein